MLNFWRINKKVRYDEKSELKGELNFEEIMKALGDSEDIIIKDVYINGDKNFNLKLIGVDGIIDQNIIDENILKPLVIEEIFNKTNNEKDLYNLIEKGSIYHISQKSRDKLNDAVNDILDGYVVLVFNGVKKAISFEVRDIPKRGIEESTNESVLKGGKDAFIENLRTNTGLIRKKIKSHNLRINSMFVGNSSRTKVAIVYLDGIADNDILKKVKERIQKINVEDLISSGKLEEQIVDGKYSIFPQIIYTERVDKFCSNIVDGKIGILIDGLPISYIAPALFPMLFQAPEDYSQNYFISSFLRIIRYICLFITLFLPGFYVAITSFHQEMIPTELAISIIQSKEGVPFSTFLEVFFMLLAFEVLIEASLRLPRTIGAAISIIGGLVVGEAAVNAKFLSPAVVVIVSIVGISGFVIPNQAFANSIRICRIIILLACSLAGLFGMIIAFIVILYHLCKIEIFGIPYLVPYAANEGKGLLRDTIFRLPFISKNKGIK